MICTIPYSSTTRSKILSNTKTGSTQDTMWLSNEWNYWPVHLSVVRPPPHPPAHPLHLEFKTDLPYLWPDHWEESRVRVYPQPTEAAEEGRGRPWKSGGGPPSASGVTGTHEAYAWMSSDSTSRSKAKKNENGNLDWRLKVMFTCFQLSPFLEFTTWPFSSFSRYDHNPSKEHQNIAYSWAHPTYVIVKQWKIKQ